MTKKSKILQEKYASLLNELHGDDIEINHVYADKMLTSLLLELGFDDVVNEYHKINKWYA